MTTEAEPRTSAEIGGMGHSVKRKEDPRFIRGQGEYIDDVNLPGQLWLDIVRSPYAHATIKSIDASEALKIPGVAAVVTGKDLEGYKLHWMPTLAGDMQMVLPVDTVMYQSQEVAAVIATSRYAPPTASPRSSSTTSRCRSSSTRTRRSSPTPSSSGPTAARTSRTTTSGTGNRATRPRPTPRLAAAEVRIERGHLHPAHPRRLDRDVRLRRRLEPGPRAAHPAHDVARRRTPSGPWSRSSRPAPACRSPSRTSGSMTHDIGGGFGGKVPVYPGYVLAVAASFLTGKPVKWIEDRSENLQADSFARDYHIHAEMGATKDGKITEPQGQDPRRPRLHRRRRRPVEVPGRPVQRDHRQSYDFAERVRRGRRRLHQQAARRRGLPLLVPRDRGGPRHRADGRHPRPRHRQGPGPAPDGELHPARAVPVQDPDRLVVRLGELPGRRSRWPWT